MKSATVLDSTRVDPSATPPSELVAMRHPGRLLAALLLLLAAASLGYSAITNHNFEWPVVWDYLFHPKIMAGLRTTLVLTAVSMSLGIILGVVLAACRMSENRVLSTLSGAYLWFFRGTPLLVQLIFWFNLSALYPRLSLSVPFGGPEIVGASTNSVLSLWAVAIIGLTLNESAYMAEIVRGGLLSVPKHQGEAAVALGMNRWQTFSRVVLPQALRVIVPPTGNQVIGMLKHSSLVSIIALSDLLYSAQLIYSQNFRTIPLLVVISIWYLVCTTVLSYAQSHIERHYGRGVHVGPHRPGGLATLRSLGSRLSQRSQPNDTPNPA
ncbi:amino acid ABC transporter permease [Streptomyces sp. NPDC046909]|uniref:amino acid ABC transporter permease n=1 Tax=Streptomyces sp. NPDC046909 TaxID=3155617 RepID=UPI0033DA4694